MSFSDQEGSVNPACPPQGFNDGQHHTTGEVNTQPNGPSLNALGNHQSVSPQTPTRRRGIDDCIAEMVEGSPKLPLLDNFDGDTLVFISAPPQEPKQSDQVYRHVQAHFRRPLRMHSKQLSALHSTFFNKRMAPRVQQRELASNLILKRHQYGHRPLDIHYVLDLTPSTEGEDVIEQIVNLSCPTGVLLWHQSQERWEISATMVGGKDDFSSPLPSRPPTVFETHTIHQRTQSSDAAPSPPAAADTDKLPPEYSQLRHYLSIQRVLLAIAGQDPQLDSAPKLYSFAMIIKTLGLPGPAERLTDWVLRWMRADPNTRFLEALPEVTLKIAEALMCEVLAQDAFAVLVGEAALDFVCPPAYDHPTSISPRPRQSAFGRVKGELEERWQDRLEHARISFVDIVNKAAEELMGADMCWIEELPEVQAMMKREDFGLSDDQDVRAAIQDFVWTLKIFVRGSIRQLLHSRYEIMYNPGKFEKPGGDDLYPRLFPKKTWDRLPVEARIFTRAFWDLLSGWTLDIKTFNMQLATNLSASVVKTGYSPLPHPQSLDPIADLSYTKVDCEIVRQKWEKLATEVYISKHGAKHNSLAAAYGIFKSALPIRSVPTRSDAGASSATWSSPATSSTAIEGHLPILPKPSTAGTTFAPGSSTAPATSTPASTDSLRLHPTFFIPAFLRQVQLHLVLAAGEMLGPPVGEGQHIGSETIDVALTNTLVCLRVEQLRLLPLWAGGDDDGSGGAFADCVPNHMGEGFAAGAMPNGHSEASADGFDMVSADGESGTGLGTSLAVGDGYSDCLDRRRVYDAESIATMETEERDGARTPARAQPETSAAGFGMAKNGQASKGVADEVDEDFTMVANEDLMQDDSDGDDDFEMPDSDAMMDDDELARDLAKEKGKNVVYRYLDNLSDELLTRP